MKLLTSISRYLVGGLFIFSGLIKINDPVGTQIKLEEYFTVFSVDIAPFFDALKPAALFLSVLLSTLEIVLGLAVLLRYKPQLVTKLLLAMILFFTFLTFYSAYFNKVTDCGCFGDAIKLTPWESFTKDIILLVLILVLFLNRKKEELTSGFKTKSIVLAGTLVFCLVISFLAIAHLPFIDFRAYKDSYLDLNSLISALGNQVEAIAVTASSGDQFEELRHSVQLAVPYVYSDATLLKTMVRSNPGLVLVENGTILKKWHYNDIPSASDLMSSFR